MKKTSLILIMFLIAQNVCADTYITENNRIGACDLNSVYNNNGTTWLMPEFEPIEYTCGAGYFLPANTSGCQPCPNGFTCNGGTFLANEHNAQGLDETPEYIQASTNTCATNVLNTINGSTWLVPEFEPITINVNFDDGNGNITSTTCEYGDTITIPETVPTRTGYNFTGWVVRPTPSE